MNYFGFGCVAVSCFLFSFVCATQANGQIDTADGDVFQGITDRADILLVTSDELASAWNDFAIWKTKTGRPTKIITLSEIEETFEGIDLQDKIRQACLAHIKDEQTRWVILGGDSRGRNRGVVPDRDTDHTGFYKYGNLPTDIYYLSEANWDANDDGVFGSFEDDMEAVEYTNKDATIGRIPVRTAEDIAAYTSKVIGYEAAYPTDDFSQRFVYTCPERGAYPKLETSRQELMSQWKGGEVEQFFAAKSPWDGKQDGDYDLSAKNWVEMINSGRASKMHMHGHGILPMWILEDESKITADSVEKLKNKNAYPVVTTVSCFTGHFDSLKDPSITESMLRLPDAGAIAIIAPSREGIAVFHERSDMRLMVTEGKMDGTTETLTKFWQHALNGEATIGEAFRAARVDMTEDGKKTDGYHFVQCELNLLGDPSLDPRASKADAINANVELTRENVASQLAISNAANCQVCVWDGEQGYWVQELGTNGSTKVSLGENVAKKYHVAVFGTGKNTFHTTVEK